MSDPYLAAALESIPPSLESLATVNDCYAPAFIRAFSACTLPARLEIRRSLKAKFRGFLARDFDQLVKEAERDLAHAQNGQVGAGWHQALLVNKNGSPLAVIENALIAFRCAPEWRGCLNFDLSSMDVVVKCPPPWEPVVACPRIWSDQDDTAAAAWLQRQGIMLKSRETAEAIQAVAHEHSFHPFRDYLDGLPEWDQTERIDYWLETYLGARAPQDVEITECADTLAYIRDVSAKFLIGAVARAKQPGCKHDTCLVFEGPQGILKSTALRTMFEPWFTDDMPDIHTKDASQATRGAWLIELGELDGFTSKSDVAKLKAFLSRATDRFRPPYGRRLIRADRESVFAGSVNKATYLLDETGGRRFWPITCGEIDIPGLKAARPMLWAEALARYNEPEPCWWLKDAAIIRESTRQQEDRYEQDPWQDLITPWLESPKQRFLTQNDPIEPFTSTPESTTVLEVLLHAIGKRSELITQADQNRVSRSLRSLKRERRRLGPRGDQVWRWYRPVAVDSNKANGTGGNI